MAVTRVFVHRLHFLLMTEASNIHQQK